MSISALLARGILDRIKLAKDKKKTESTITCSRHWILIQENRVAFEEEQTQFF